MSRGLRNTEMAHQYELSDTQHRSFKERGFVLLDGLLTNDILDTVKEKVDGFLARPTDKYQTGFARLKYDILTRDPFFIELIRDRIGGVVCNLAKQDLLHTQTLAFELKQQLSSGFPWHIGTQSFGFQRAEDFGCTLWIPLIKIDNSRQKGGMSYVPKNTISGRFVYDDVDPAAFDLLEAAIAANKEITLEEYIELRDGVLNSSAMRRLLNYFAVTDDFELGDALLFDKYVIHRSVVLESGVEPARAALAIRFAGYGSRYDKKRAERLEVPRRFFNYEGPTRFHLDVAQYDGQLLRDGQLYKNEPYRHLRFQSSDADT